MTKIIELLNENGQVFATSKQVAEDFGKQHGHVLRDIENLKKDVSNFGEMFTETKILDKYNREQPAYNLNKDGFTLLAFGFNGKKAMQFKLDYINAFNNMEAQLKELDTVKATSPVFDLEYYDVKFKTTQRVKKYFKDEAEDLTVAYDNFVKWSRKRLNVKQRIRQLEHILVAVDLKCKENGSINNSNYYRIREDVIALRERILRDIDEINNRSYGQKVSQAKKAI
ncbi:Rha family transcriptional regulator [Lysinibacillus sphaericus]|uniref:Phage-related antirepressor n=1 Tax=Lysinibacillus sphaericus OT4b.31 TaxID=1285586 RepID=R7ZDR2_LYSSH|nr:Rha family transcriptional regulator [Lysinibacillus sphaericus]EON72238.1 phage-related antirepressor [Lysinibacillus sphaericus OT4b.31]